MKRSYSILAIILLAACCYMTLVKAMHHHPAQCAEEMVCIIDGEDIDSRHAHQHPSIIPQYESQDECIICHFSIAKILSPDLYADIIPIITIETVNSGFIVSISDQIVDIHQSRAPPVC